MKHGLNRVMNVLLVSGAYLALQAMTKAAFKFPMTMSCIRIPIFGIVIAICIAFPIDLIICILCAIGYLLFGIFSIIYIFANMILLIFQLWRGFF